MFQCNVFNRNLIQRHMLHTCLLYTSCGAEYGDLKQEDPKPADKTTEGKKDDTKPAATTTVKNDTKPAEKPDKKTVKAKKVVVNKKCIVLKKGKKVKLKVKLKPANATEKVTFKSCLLYTSRCV